MDEALIQVGLPVKCIYADCQTRGFVKPGTDYGGWYKARIYRKRKNKWFCPEHYNNGKEADERFYKTPQPELKDTTEEELYKLLED